MAFQKKIYGYMDFEPSPSLTHWKGLPGTNDQAYFKKLKITAVKSFITWTPGVNVIKLFSFIADNEAQ